VGRFRILDLRSVPRRAFVGLVLFGFLLLLWVSVGAVAQTPAEAAATTQTQSFADVPFGSPYQTAIDALHQQGIVGGYLDAGLWLFKPGDPVLRAQFAKMICGVLGLTVTEGSVPPFTDVGPNDPATLYPDEYVAAVASRGITTGTGPGLFSPWNNITRAQLVTMIVRAANTAAPGTLTLPSAGFAGSLGDFDPSHAPAMRTAEWNGLLTGLIGFGPAWDPWTEASRGEAAEMLARLLALVAPPGGSTTTTTPPASTTTTTAGSPQPLGANVAINLRLFPADNPWNTDISSYPVHPLSARYVAAIGASTHLHPDFGTVWNGAPNGIPYVVVSGNQPKVPVDFYYPDESDPGPYPIPADAPIEGGPSGTGDRHILILDPDHRLLYELYDAHLAGDHWEAGSGAIFDLTSNALRPDTWTSADAAGLPMLPGLVRYDEVESGEITHALRFTVDATQRAFVHPATHYASDDTNPDLPPMGLRLRLRADYDISGFPTRVQVILRALKKYGMIVADNGSSWYVNGAPDPRWDDDELHTISQVPGSAFEAVYTGPIITP
jgi:hypothetical protein